MDSLRPSDLIQNDSDGPGHAEMKAYIWADVNSRDLKHIYYRCRAGSNEGIKIRQA